LNSLQLDSNEKEMLEHIITQMEKERGMDRAAAIIDMRYEFIRSLCMHTITQPKESKERIRSRKIDKVLAGKYTSIPVFFLIM